MSPLVCKVIYESEGGGGGRTMGMGIGEEAKKFGKETIPSFHQCGKRLYSENREKFHQPRFSEGDLCGKN